MKRRSRIALLAFALMSLPVAASAAPATVTVFEAKVHSAPDPSSPVIHTFTENARISVSEEATHGFRRVRLPNGKVGYIEESAISLAPQAGPPQGPPPAPPYAAPPPPPMAPPPPPGAYPYPPYRRVVVVDPYAFRHVGLFLRFGFGMGYADSSTNASQTFFIFDSSHGFALDFDFAIGGAVKENLILAGEFWSTWLPSPSLSLRGASIASGGLWNSTFGFGPQLTWYLMPTNVFFSVTPSLTWTSFSDYYATYTTDLGFGTRFKVGKEWWVAPHVGLGVSGWFIFSTNKEGGGANATWWTYAGGVGFTTTFN